MRTNFLICGSIIVGLAVTSTGCRADPVAAANAVRLQGCGERPAVAQTLRPRDELNEAARRVASGEKLKAATARSGYRAKKSAWIRLPVTAGDDGVAPVLAQRFCDIVADPSLREIGIHRRSEETWIVLATPLALSAGQIAGNPRRRVVALINEARSQVRRCGREKFPAGTPLTRSAALENAALVHARDIANRSRLGHEGSDGSMPADRATRAGYHWVAVAENVAAGQTTAEEVVGTWLDSAGHCANLMNPKYSETGVAYAINPADEMGIYWVQVFAAPE